MLTLHGRERSVGTGVKSFSTRAQGGLGGCGVRLGQGDLPQAAEFLERLVIADCQGQIGIFQSKLQWDGGFQCTQIVLAAEV